jgi:AbrB family looped-hinge helix DNA binding protein
MQTKVSTKGQVVIPGPLRRRLGLRAGDPLDANIEAGRIVLSPHKKRLPRISIVTDPITGLPVLSGGSGAPVLSSRDVAEILNEFP